MQFKMMKKVLLLATALCMMISGAAVAEGMGTTAHTVVFYDYNGQEAQSLAVMDGEWLYIPEMPVQEGHTFSHWYEEGQSSLDAFIFAPVTSDLHLHPFFFANATYGNVQQDAKMASPADLDAMTTEVSTDEMVANLAQQILDVANTNTVRDIQDEVTPLAGPRPQPVVEVAVSYEGKLALGTPITVTAVLSGVEDTTGFTYQWQNNAGGTYQDVAGATGPSYTFNADYDNTACEWRVNVGTGN